MPKSRSDKQLIFLFTLLCCLVYFVSYMTRLNYAAGLTEIRYQLNISKELASLPVTGCFITYGIGQIVCGLLGDNIAPRNMIFCGLTATSLCNFAAYFTQDIWVLTFFWCVNGFFQSMLWPPLVRIMAETLDEENYQKCCTKVLIASSVGTIAVYLFVPACLTFASWRFIFLMPACAGLLIAFIWICGISASDRISTKKSMELFSQENPLVKPASPTSDLKSLLIKAALPFIAFACILHGALRDGITTWMPTYITETFHISPSLSILTTALLPIFSIFSITLAAWLCRRVKNEVTLSAGLFAACCGFLCVLLFIYRMTPVLSISLMTFSAGCMHGVNLMLLGRIPRYFRVFGKVSSISGILNAVSYAGSALSSFVFAALAANFGWGLTICVWFIIALAGLVFCLFASKKWEDFRHSHSSLL